jgi:hypothetical protein
VVEGGAGKRQRMEVMGNSGDGPSGGQRQGQTFVWVPEGQEISDWHGNRDSTLRRGGARMAELPGRGRDVRRKWFEAWLKSYEARRKGEPLCDESLGDQPRSGGQSSSSASSTLPPVSAPARTQPTGRLSIHDLCAGPGGPRGRKE